MSGEARGSTLSVIGAGRVGTAVAYILSSKGYRVTMVCSPDPGDRERAAELTGAEATEDPVRAAAAADTVLVTTPDDEIEEVCAVVAGSGLRLAGKRFVHMSGAKSLEALDPVMELGARTFSIHPLQTFADLDGAIATLPGSTFGVTCSPADEPWARALVEDLGGTEVIVRDSDKYLYHAAAVIAGNLLVMIEHAAVKVYEGLGVGEEEAIRACAPLFLATASNVARLGAAGALTGPLARGDVGTVRANLRALDGFDPEVAALYRAVSLWGLGLVRELGAIDAAAIDEMKLVLEQPPEGGGRRGAGG